MAFLRSFIVFILLSHKLSLDLLALLGRAQTYHTQEEYLREKELFEVKVSYPASNCCSTVGEGLGAGVGAPPRVGLGRG